MPENASSGVITVDCGQLAGQPLLRVAEPPTARIAVRMRAGSKRIVFDGRRSRDAGGKAVKDRWKIGARVAGKGQQVSLALRPRFAPYRVRLTVTDRNGKTDSAQLTLLRLPAPLFEFEKATPLHPRLVGRERRALERAARRHPPAAIEVDGNADDPGTVPYNAGLALRRAENLRDALLTAGAHASSAGAPVVPVTTRAFGESCPIVRGGGRRQANRRVEVFILDAGVSVLTPHSCKPGKVEHTSW